MNKDKRIEVTPAMIEAGVKELFWYDGKGTYISREEAVTRIFRAMLLSRGSASGLHSEYPEAAESSEGGA